jgi:uncharacterized RDD family membrane protein YckC
MSTAPPPPPPPPIGEPPVGTAVGGLPLASAWMRVLARFLDAMIVGLVFGYILAVIVLSGDDDAGVAGFGTDTSFGRAYLYALLLAAVGFGWDAVCTRMFGGTPMKLALGMKVVQQNGADVEWEHAIRRWALPGAFALLPPIVGINVLVGLAQIVIVIVSLVFIFTKPLRTALWDQFADTMVVTTR